jgi:hypothetical protein
VGQLSPLRPLGRGVPREPTLDFGCLAPGRRGDRATLGLGVEAPSPAVAHCYHVHVSSIPHRAIWLSIVSALA